MKANAKLIAIAAVVALVVVYFAVRGRIPVVNATPASAAA